MPEQFNDKDYGDYFSALEKSVEKNPKGSQRTSREKNDEVSADWLKKLLSGNKLRPWVYITAAALAALVVLATVIAIGALIISLIATKSSTDTESTNSTTSQTTQNNAQDATVVDTQKNFAVFDENTQAIAADIDAKNIIVVNCDTNKVVAARDASAKCYPASTTKIMTVLTAVDYIDDYNKTFTYSYEVTDQFYQQEATMAGFADGEAATLTDMLYGAILESGADATYGIAVTVAGSEEEFVKLMNKKAQQLGLKNTNFTNSSGLFDKNHYTTPEDLAVIVRAAMNNELCRKILSTYQYTTAKTPQHPDGIPLTSTLFSYMYGTEPEGSDIKGGKTGFVNESGHCFATFGQSDGGIPYVCVTLNGAGRWPTVYDQIDLYTRYAK